MSANKPDPEITELPLDLFDSDEEAPATPQPATYSTSMSTSAPPRATPQTVTNSTSNPTSQPLTTEAGPADAGTLPTRMRRIYDVAGVGALFIFFGMIFDVIIITWRFIPALVFAGVIYMFFLAKYSARYYAWMDGLRKSVEEG